MISIHFPGMENGCALLREIQKGYRMEIPKYSPHFLGEMMKNCWQKDPKERPTFSESAEIIEKQIESVVGFDYLNMNDGPISENGPIGETLVDSHTQTNRLQIVQLLNETTQLQDSQLSEDVENLCFFSGS